MTDCFFFLSNLSLFSVGVGKTELGYTLEKRSSPFDDTENRRTRGVDVRTISIRGVSYSLWDYAGQVEVGCECDCVCECGSVCVCVCACACVCLCFSVFLKSPYTTALCWP